MGSRFHHIRAFDIQLIAVSKESIGIIFCNLHDGFMLPAGALEHLILSGIRIRGQMSHIGDVHHPFQGISLVAQRLFQHILHDVAAKIADMGIVVYRRTTGIHFHKLGIVGGKEFFFMGSRVIKVHIFFLLV